jgi:hypothetical protein
VRLRRSQIEAMAPDKVSWRPIVPWLAVGQSGLADRPALFHFRRPRLLNQPGQVGQYDMAAMRRRFERLIAFNQLNAANRRISVSPVDPQSSTEGGDAATRPSGTRS